MLTGDCGLQWKASPRPVFQAALAVVVLAATLARPLHADPVLWYEQPADQWTEALPVGNGRLGAMVFGKTGRERIQLNEDTIWAGSPQQRDIPGAGRHLPEIRRLLFAGKYADAQAKVAEELLGPRIAPKAYQTLGDLWIDLGLESRVGYRRELDLQTGIARTEWFRDGVAFTREVFASAPDGVLVVRIEADVPGTITGSVELARDSGATTTAPGPRELMLAGRASHGSRHQGVRFQARLRAVVDGGSVQVASGKLQIADANAVTLILAAATNYRGALPEAAMMQQVLAAETAGYAAVREAHVADHRAIFNRVRLELGDPARSREPTDARLRSVRAGAEDPDFEATYFQFGRYLLMGSSRPGTMPANLQGIWNKDIAPVWNADYHINVNTQMNYWPADVTNLSEMQEPLWNMLDRLRVRGRATATEHYGIERGSVAHHTTDAWWWTSPIGHPGYGMWPTGGAWLSRHLWEAYQFDLDAEFLRKRAYPVLKEAAEFFLDWLVAEPTTGLLVSGPSISPENAFVTENGGGRVSMGPSMDQQIIHDLFTNVLAAAAELDVDDSFTQEVAVKLAKLAGPQVGTDGRLLEWRQEFREPDPGHRHISHAFGLYPGSQFTVRGTPDLAAAVRKSIEHRLSNGGGSTGWSLGWLVNMWARLEAGGEAHGALRSLLTEMTMDNLFDLHPATAGASTNVVQVDGNLGGTAGIAEMLLQSHAGEIHVLPALPPQWDAGVVEGLKARGGFEVSMAWSEGALSKLSIHSHAGEECRVRVAGGDLQTLTVRRGETSWFDGELSEVAAPESHAAPEAVRVTWTTGTSLTIGWRAPQFEGRSVSDYDVQYVKRGDSGYGEWPHAGLTRLTTITGLRPGATYQVRVRARNAAGPGAWSEPVEGTTSLGVTIATDAARVREGEPATFALTLTDPAPEALRVSVQVTEDGSMVAAGSPGSLTFAVGETTATLAVATASDDVVEPDSAITATLLAGSGYTTREPSAVSVTVWDDDAPLAARFEDVPANHDGSSFDIKVYFSEEVAIGYRAFQEERVFELTGAAVARAVRLAAPSNKKWRISLEPDGVESVMIALPADRPCGEAGAICTSYGKRLLERVRAEVPGPRTRATPVASVAASTVPVAEGSPAVFEATLDRASDAALTVAVSVSGSDGVLAGTPPTSVAFAAGQTSATLSVATVDDRVVEADGAVTATLVAGTGYTLGATTSADVTVTDDDVAAFAVTAAPSLIEEGGAAIVTVAIDNGVTFAADRAVAFAASGLAADQYRLAPATVTLAAGATAVTTTFEVLSDTAAEEPAAVTVTASVDGAAVGSATVTVEDPAPLPTIAGVPQVGGVLAAEPAGADGYEWLRAGEPIAGAADVRYAPVEADVGLALSVRVNARGRWRTSAPTIPIWAAPVSPPLSAGEEELLGTTMTLGRGAAKVQLGGFLRRGDWEAWPEDFGSVDDAAFADGRHELRLFLINGLGKFALGTSPAIGDATDVTAYWNEHALGPLEERAARGVTTWEAPSAPGAGWHEYARSEGVRVAVSIRRPLPEATLSAETDALTEGASATYTVALDRAAWSALEVTVTVTETGAMLSGTVPATVAFAAGESTATLTLATDDDAVVEGDGAVTVALVAGDGYLVGTAATAETAVTDDDAAAFSVSASPSVIDEGAVSTLTVSIANGVTFAGEQRIDLSVSGTAVPDDYRLSATGLDLAAGTSSVSATLTAVRDVWAEPAETVTVTASRAGSTVGSATVTIAANEAVVSTVTVTPVATPVAEGAAAQFELRLDAAALAALSVSVSVTETGSMLSGTAPSTVAFAVGESSRVVSLATVDDTVVESDSAVTLTLGTGSGYTPGGSASAVVTVADNDSATFSVSSGSEEIDEGDETRVTVSIGNGVTFAADQAIALTVSGTATADDYRLAPDALTLTAGASLVEATLTAVDDTDEEPAETITVTASRAGTTVGSVTVTVRASDVPSDDATLASLVLSGVDIGPFSPDATDYTAAVETEVASTTVTATANDAGAAVVIADGTGSTVGATRTVSLAEGDNAITATVTAEDGETTRAYRVTVTRAFAAVWGERLADRDIELGASAFPSGLWSDGSTLWVIENWSRGAVRAYALADGSRLADGDFTLGGGNGFPSGLWSDGETLWVADHNGGVTAHRLSDGSRLEAEDLDGSVLGSAGNLSPTGLWSDGETLWVADHASAKVFAYRLSDKARLVGKEFDLVDGNGTPMPPFGLWSDGELVLASNYLLGGVLGYGLADGSPRPARSLDTSASGTANPMGVWSDGRVLWVVDDLARRAYAYAVPGLGRTRSTGVFPIRPSNRAFGVPSASAGGRAVWIPDGGLRKRIAAALGKPAEVPIGERELAALESLDARDGGVTDLTGLAYAVGLTDIDLGRNAIVDLRVLAELPSLTVLNLDGTTADVWPLAGVTGLRRLSLRGGGLTDVQALGGMTALRVLDIGGNGVADLAPLGGLSKLEALRADGNGVEDTSALHGLEGLRILDLGGGRPEDRSR